MRPPGEREIMSTATPPKIAFEPIECEYLDKDNLNWAKAYLAKHQQRLEEASDDMAPEVRRFLEAEIAAYQDLIDRFTKT